MSKSARESARQGRSVMRIGKSRRVVFGMLLLGTTAHVSPVLAQAFDNQVSAKSLDATNTSDVYATTTLATPQTINTGIGNNIGANATGALAAASVNQTFSQSTINQGGNIMGGNQVVVGAISATNNTTTAPIMPALANVEAVVTINGFSQIGNNSGGPIFSGGISNSIGSAAAAAVASASIVQSFDTNTNIDPTTLASNSVTATTITATNTDGTVRASLDAGGFAQIWGGITNSISAQAAGASAGATVAMRYSDTTIGTLFGAPPVPTSNVVTTGALSATNQDAVTAVMHIGSQGAGTITNGNGNFIGAQAFGASGSAAISEAVAFNNPDPLGTVNVMPLSALANNTVTTGTITALNGVDGAVTATIGDIANLGTPIGTATISNGAGNSIAAQAVGASAGASINQRFDNVSAVPNLPLALGSSNSVTTETLSATNSGTISAVGYIAPLLGTTTITAGAANSIGTSATGASAGGNITQGFTSSFFNMGATLGANTVTVQGDGITATNTSTGGVTSTLNMGTATISGGTGNSIAAGATGASASLGIAQQVVNTNMLPGGIQGGNFVTLDATAGLSASNAGSIQGSFNPFGQMTITSGAGNSMGASGIGAAASAGINQAFYGGFVAMDALGGNTVVVQDNGLLSTAALSATNSGAVGATIGPLSSWTALISDGVANSITAQAVGAAVNASITTRLDNTIALSTAIVRTNSVDTTAGVAGGGSGNLLATNSGAVTAIMQAPPIGGNLTITAGAGNSIGAAAIGATAAAAITQSVSFDSIGMFGLSTITTSLFNLFSNNVTTASITAVNSGAVQASMATNGNATIGAGFPTPIPSFAGVGNSIAAQAVGAAANASISSRFHNMVTTGSLSSLSANTIVTGDLTATNTGVVSAQALFAGGSLLINNGIGNFIGSSAVGASAGGGIVQSVSQTFGQFPFDLTVLPGNSVTLGAVSANNNFDGLNLTQVTATLTITGGAINMGLAALGFSTGNVGNSISAQAVGASASASISTQVFNTAVLQNTTNAKTTNTVQADSLSSTNGTRVTATATFSGLNTLASIGGGVGNSIGASATGASSAASINQVVSTSLAGTTLNTLAANTVTVTDSITAQNSGRITASLNSSTIGLPTTAIFGGVGNSIAATAVGASASASISQVIANVH